MAAPTTYAWIPPPPLPQFYLPTKASNNANSASSTSAEDALSALVKTKTKTKVQVRKQSEVQTFEADGCAERPSQLPPMPGDATDETTIKFTTRRPRATSAAFSNLPPPPPGFGNDVPPLAVYHICRICLRPRSARYHREHPIPINAVPPPPGICRRCRVTRIEEEVITETEVRKPTVTRRQVEVVTQGESNNIQLGLACIIPKEDYVTRQERKDERGRRLLKEYDRQQRMREESEEPGQVREITYRHLRVRDTERTARMTAGAAKCTIPPLPPPQKPRTSVNSTAQDAMDAVSVRSEKFMMTTAAAATTGMQVQPTQMPSSRSVHGVSVTELAKADTAKALSSASSSTTARSGAKVSARATSVINRPECTDSEIRRIAREEVERYRQAERKMKAHPNAYARGRMVPVERRIERESDAPEAVPWRSNTERFEIHVEREKEVVKQPTSTPKRSAPTRLTSRTVEEWEKLPTQSDRSEVRVERKKEVKKQQTPSSKRSAPSEVRSRIAEEHENLDSQRQPSEKYTGSGWSSVREQQTAEREVVIERVVRRDSQAARSARSVETRQSSAQPEPNVAAVVDFRRTGPNSSASDKTRWAGIAGMSSGSGDSKLRPPVSLQMREVLDSGDGPRHFEAQQVWPPLSDTYNVAEIMDPVERPTVLSKSGQRLRGGEQQSYSRTDSRISERVKELQEDAERRERAEHKLPPLEERPASPRTSKLPKRGYWVDDGMASGHSARYEEADVIYRREEVRTDALRGPSALSDRAAASEQSKRTQSSRQKVEHTEDTPGDSGRVRAFDRRWAAAAEDQKQKNAAWVEEQLPDRCRDDSDRADASSSAPSAPARSTRSARSPETEYIHIQRTVRPADGLWDPKPCDDRPQEFTINRDELLRFDIPNNDPPPPPRSQTKALRRREPDDRDRKHQQAARVSPSETSTRVRFASKIEFSPTPPGSDASSSQFRIIGAKGGKHRKMDGEMESGQDLIAEYERRGRARARDRAIAPAAEEREKVYYYERDTWGPEEPRDRDRATARPGDGTEQLTSEVDDPAYRPRKSRPLVRALSESPSRERLSEIFSERQSKISSRSKVDGIGPYRPEEPRPMSLEVEDDSVHARTSGRSGHDHGGWTEEMPGGNAW